MFPSSNKGVGMNIGFPDVCLTPAGPAAVPVPYPNLALNAQAAPFSVVVKTTMVPALNMGSIIPMTNGDQAGSLSPIMGPGMFTAGNPKVFVEKLPGINLTCSSTGNNMNNGLGAQLVASISKVFYTLASERSPEVPAKGEAHALSGDALGRLVDALQQPLSPAEPVAPGTAMLRIPVFSSETPSRVFSAIRALRQEGLRALILDLRGCPGGDVNACFELASDFLTGGAVLAIEEEADGDENEVRSRAPRGTSPLFGMPLAILVDGGTASAAEIFAGALAHHGRAALVGTKTLGKGSGQKIALTETGTLARATVSVFSLPDRKPIDGAGLTPTLFAPDLDSALQAALAWLDGADLQACTGSGSAPSPERR